MKNGMRTCSLIIVMILGRKIVLIFLFLSDAFSRNTCEGNLCLPLNATKEKHKVTHCEYPLSFAIQK